MFKRFVNKFKEKISKFLFEIKFYKNNKHNNLVVTSHCYRLLDWNKIVIGKGTYGKVDITFFGNDGEFVSIGNYCSIGEGTSFICGGNHNMKTVSTFPFDVYFGKNKKSPSYSKGPIVLEDDVWIGRDVLILSGVKIGKGAVVGARSVVTHDVPPYAVVCGNPARVLKYRFDYEIINKLLDLNYNKIDLNNLKLYEVEITKENCENIFKQIMK